MLLLVTIDVGVADVTDQVAIAIKLIWIRSIRTVIASITQAIAIRVTLIWIGCLGTIVTRIENSCMMANEKKSCKTELFDSFAVHPTVIIEIVVTGVSLSITIRVFLVKIGNSGAVIASVTFFVGTFRVRICLIWICYQWTIVLKMVTRISKQNVINKMAASSYYRRHALSSWRMGRLMTQGNLTKNTTSFRI